MHWLSEEDIRFLGQRPINIRATNFFERCWSEGAETYANRLKAGGFEGLKNVLDVGCGIGHWTACLAGLNEKITAIDIDEDNLKFTGEIIKKLDLKNVSLKKDNASDLSFAEGEFDGVFSYSMCFITDWRKTLKEFYRVLRKNGRCYVQANDLGRYLYMFMEEPNKSGGYDPRQEAIDAINHSFRYFSGGDFTPGKQLIMPMDMVLKEMREMGFSIAASGADGTINLSGQKSLKSFYPDNYYGVTGAYEILAIKE